MHKVINGFLCHYFGLEDLISRSKGYLRRLKRLQSKMVKYNEKLEEYDFDNIPPYLWFSEIHYKN